MKNNKKYDLKQYVIKYVEENFKFLIWDEIKNSNFLCYEDNLELANEVVCRLFDKDIFNDIATYYRIINKQNGNVFKVLCKLEDNVYFQFDIVTRYGIDIPQKITNGKFRGMFEIPKGWKDIWELWEQLEDEKEKINL